MRLSILLTLSALTCPMASAQTELQPTPELESTRDKVSYGIGLNIGGQFKTQGLDVDPKLVLAGIMSALSDGEPALTPAEIRKAFTDYEAEKAVRNKEAAVAFLAKNKSEDGVKSTKSGMQYKVLKEGTGQVPTTKNTVTTHYRGKLISGKVFDESYKGDTPTEDDKPVSFGVTQVIAGWTEALQLMKVGSKYRLFIPPELAYGEQGPPGIGSNSLLIFDIELIGVK